MLQLWGGLAKLFFNNTQLLEWHSEGPHKGKLKATPSRKLIDTSSAHKEIIMAFQLANLPTQSQITRGLSRLQRVVENLESAAFAAGIGSPVANNIMTLVHTFFTDKKPTDKGMLPSYNYIAQNSVDRNSPLYNDKRFSSQTVREKGLAADRLLSAIVAHLGSIASRKTVSASYLNRAKTFKVKTTSIAVGAFIANQLKNASRNHLFSVQEDSIIINKDAKEYIEGYTINSSGITDPRGKKLISISGGKKNIPTFTLEDVTADEIAGILKMAGIKRNQIWKAVLRKYINTIQDDENPKGFKVQKDALAEIAGMIAYTAQAAIDPSFSNSDSRTTKKYIENYYEKNAYKQDSLENIIGEVNVEAEEAGTGLYKPSDLTRLIDNISKAQSDMQLNHYSRHSYNVANKLVYRDIKCISYLLNYSQ